MNPYEQRIAQIARELGAPQPKGAQLFPEANELVSIGQDIYGREQRLIPAAAAEWEKMRAAAESDGEILQLISAYRSVAYQKQIIERKRAAGQSWEQILRVNMLPGYSEHHTGRAIDLSAPNFEPLTEAFETSSAFTWLSRRARKFGFAMTYPRENTFGIAYEPWHWTFHESR